MSDKHIVRFGTKNDGPKTVEFEKLEDAEAFAESVGGKVTKPRAARPTAKPVKPVGGTPVKG